MSGMIGIGGNIGGGGKKRNPYANTPISTGYSTISGGNVTIDPSIRAIQEQGLARNNNLYNELGTSAQGILGNLQDTRSRYAGNQSAYIQSQIDPLNRELTARQGGLERSIGLRGVSGSSFGDQALTNFGIDKQRSLADTRAKAEFDNLQALTGIDSQMAQTLFNKIGQQMSLTGMDNETAQARLAQELSALGAGQSQINAASEAFANWQKRLIGTTGVNFNASIGTPQTQPKPPQETNWGG